MLLDCEPPANPRALAVDFAALAAAAFPDLPAGAVVEIRAAAAVGVKQRTELVGRLLLEHFGPDDLSQDLGIPGQMQNPALLATYEEIFAICRRRQVSYGLSAQSPEMAETWVAKGCTWIPFQNDATMVINAARAAVPKLMQAGGRA